MTMNIQSQSHSSSARIFHRNGAKFSFALLAAFTFMAVTSPGHSATRAQGVSTFSEFFGLKSTKPKTRKIRKTRKRVTQRAYLGRAPYICSPSGFGRTSRCRAR